MLGSILLRSPNLDLGLLLKPWGVSGCERVLKIRMHFHRRQ
ncbi:hypothetical protein RMSM_05356 [Rhodopirellula maiorica SM1]|uniref:Uncharacterized protein n=1 Tax=Rhodopirellula maiorica SM1 TaxID=1265738 RepID=M5RQR1_9BACT|nr:hypothetical protein RMSM_05356 [Rhodopirellula maiorica SM1]